MTDQPERETVLANQQAPYPVVLHDLVNRLTYRPGWTARLALGLDRGQGSRGLTLIITTSTINSYNHTEKMMVQHFMPVPPAAFDERSWQRWLLDQFILVENHEACEFFTIDDKKPYAPSHGPGNNPYLIRDIGTDLDQKTSFRGKVNE